MNSSLVDFKNFVRNNQFLIGYIRRGEKTWQEYYELYDLYGEDEKAWEDFLTIDEEKEEINSNGSKSNYIEEIINMAKKVDMDKVQEGITSLQKTLGLFGELFVNKKDNTSGQEYNPRPLYRRFED